MGSVPIVRGISPLLFLVLGCSGGTPLERCDKLAEAAWREDCRYQEIIEAVGDGERQEILEQVDLVSDEYSRDLLRFRLAIRDPVQFGWLCDEGLETSLVGSRCRAILRRPHLLAAAEE